MIRYLLPLAIALFTMTATAPAQRVDYDKFVEALQQSLRLNDDKGLDRAVRDNPLHALVHYRTLYGALQRNPSDEVATTQTAAIKESWKRVFETDTPTHVGDWMESLDADAHKKNEQAHGALRQAYSQFHGLRERATQDRAPWESLRDNVLKIAEAFESVGNVIDGSDAWGLLAQIYNNFPSKSEAERRDAVYAIERFKDLRDQWKFTKDSFYHTNVAWMEAEKQALAAGENEVANAPGASAASGVEGYLAEDADAREIVAPIEFSVQRKPRETDYSVQGGPVPMQWPNVNVEKEGPTKLPWFGGRDLYMVRPSASNFGITTDGNVKVGSGKGWEEIEVANRLRRPSEFDIGSESAQRPYAAWFYIGGEQEPFMGYNQNLAPFPETATVYYKSAGVWTAEVEGTEIRLYDDNSNGILFEEDPLAYGLKDRHLGESPKDETAVPVFDGMEIGKGGPQPYSEWVAIGDQWYHVRGRNAGTAIGLRPADPAKLTTGSIQLDWTGPRGIKPAILVVQGEAGLGGARFDIASGKPVEVPAGSYKIAYGRIESGKGARVMTASVFPGRMEAVQVEEGKTAKLTLGEPFTLDFVKKDVGAGAFQVDALTIRVRGTSGELYAHVNGAAPAPAVMIARDEEGHGAKEMAEFSNIRDPDIANQVAEKNKELGNQVGYYPIADSGQPETVIEIDVPEGWLMGLREEKNKLFGTLEAVYR